MRRGKWHVEEQALADMIIRTFLQGQLPEAEGHTLRTYLSGLLACGPMRITKRFSGYDSVGKTTYTNTHDTGESRHLDGSDGAPTLDQTRREIANLQTSFLNALQRNGEHYWVPYLVAVWNSRPRQYYFGPLSEGTPGGAADSATLPVTVPTIVRSRSTLGRTNTTQLLAIAPSLQSHNSLLGGKRARVDSALNLERDSAGAEHVPVEIPDAADSHTFIVARLLTNFRGTTAVSRIPPGSEAPPLPSHGLPVLDDVPEVRGMFKLSRSKSTCCPLLRAVTPGSATVS